MKRTFILAVIMAMVLVCSMQAQAALQNLGTDSLGNRLIYDSDLDITWYDYLKSYDTWLNQVNWASGLSVTFGSNVYDDWRLPITFNQSCAGLNCTNSEMAHLYYTELGNVANGGLSNTGDFQNLQGGSTGRVRSPIQTMRGSSITTAAPRVLTGRATATPLLPCVPDSPSCLSR